MYFQLLLSCYKRRGQICPFTNFLLLKHQKRMLNKTANEENRGILHEAVTIRALLRDRNADPSIPY
jgi:hypothetical protein